MTQKIRAINIANNTFKNFVFDSTVSSLINTAAVAYSTANAANALAQAANTVVVSQASQAVAPSINTISITDSSYNVIDDTAANTGGAYLRITGSGFQTGATVLVGTSNTALSTTLVDSSTLRSQIGPISSGTYPVYVVNTNGGTAIRLNGLTISSSPIWGTGSTLANVTSNTVFSGTLSANSDSSVTYANTTILPTGFTLLANGYYYGNVSVGADTTYTFGVKATDAELQDTTRTFSLTTTLLPPTYTINYLLVAGGGGGGAGQFGPGPYRGGGGGGGGVEAGTLTVTPGSVITLTIGTGGTPPPSPGAGANGPSGEVTQMASPLFGLASVLGGGGGTRGASVSTFGGSPGGSGGGSGGQPSNVAGGTGYPGQGFPGGSNNGLTGGGGGGAGGSGSSNGSAGAGYVWPFTGATYSSGGTGGPSPVNPSIFGQGGPGEMFNSNGAAGRPGVIIFAIPTPNYPGSAPGATVTTPPAAPGRTVLTFTSPGTYTA